MKDDKLKTQNQGMSRRFFIGGAALAGAFAGCKMFEAPVGKSVRVWEL